MHEQTDGGVPIGEGIDRGAFLRRAGGAGLALAGGSTLLGRASGALAAVTDSVHVTEFCWVGSGQDITPFQVRSAYLKTHPDVAIDMLQGTNAETYPKILTSVQVTPDDPLVNFGFFNVGLITQGTVDKLWLPFNAKKMPNLKRVLPKFRLPGDRGVFFASSPIGIMYNTEVFKQKGWKAPTSWKDLWNPRYKGKVAFWDAPSWSYNGLVATARMYGGSEKNIEPGMKVFEKAAKSGQIQSLYTSNSQAQQLLVSGDAWITPFFFGIMEPWVKQGAPLGYVVPKEGQIAFQLGFAMVKGSDTAQQQVAMEVVDAMLLPRVVEEWCNYTYSVPLVRGVRFAPDRQKLSAYQPKNVANQMQLDWTTIAKNNTQWLEQWNSRVKANL
ncbi:MAG TPA: extracellular solute-binding protein [Gaiellaceae bacterium]|jgi:putative spermidine/putrescine transport system substrate-binding protein